MKKKRFFNDKKRNQKWTEPEQGRKIAFADKYIEGGTSDKFDYKRPKYKGYSTENQNKNEIRLRRLIIFVCCIALISLGYIGMDIYLTRHAEPAENLSDQSAALSSMADMQISFSAVQTEGISLDNSVMLSAVMNGAQKDGYTAVAFEAKREDGTIGYASKLASVDTFAAISSPAAKPEQSIKAMLSNDVLPIAQISCYKDNVLALQANGAAIMKDKKVYKDPDGNAYLNPDSEFTYNYLRDIIVELNSYGVTVFVLSDCDLPEDISGKYGDGFEALSKKLYSDIDANIKLLEATPVRVNPKTADKDIAKLKELDKNHVYIVKTTLDGKKIISKLSKKNITTFVVKN